ncbi:uncharacterized protein V3H82_019914 [Fundulus diaphanus]
MAEQKSLGRRVDDMLSWLGETEARLEGGTTGKDEKDAELSQQLSLCKELQASLSTRSGDVSSLVSDIQLFISERAQDLTPGQSRQLLEQLQQLQTAFHRASGRAQARVDALSAQRAREEERRRRERLREEEEEDRERRSAREREMSAEESRLPRRGTVSAYSASPPFFLLSRADWRGGGKTANQQTRVRFLSAFCVFLSRTLSVCVCVSVCDLWTQSAQSLAKCSRLAANARKKTARKCSHALFKASAGPI